MQYPISKFSYDVFFYARAPYLTLAEVYISANKDDLKRRQARFMFPDLEKNLILKYGEPQLRKGDPSKINVEYTWRAGETTIILTACALYVETFINQLTQLDAMSKQYGYNYGTKEQWAASDRQRDKTIESFIDGQSLSLHYIWQRTISQDF